MVCVAADMFPIKRGYGTAAPTASETEGWDTVGATRTTSESGTTARIPEGV